MITFRTNPRRLCWIIFQYNTFKITTCTTNRFTTDTTMMSSTSLKDETKGLLADIAFAVMFPKHFRVESAFFRDILPRIERLFQLRLNTKYLTICCMNGQSMSRAKVFVKDIMSCLKVCQCSVTITELNIDNA
jgi:hypothetical protein